MNGDSRNRTGGCGDRLTAAERRSDEERRDTEGGARLLDLVVEEAVGGLFVVSRGLVHQAAHLKEGGCARRVGE